MTKTNGIALAAFLMASTAPAAFAESTSADSGSNTGSTDVTASSEMNSDHSALIQNLRVSAAAVQDWDAELENVSSDTEVDIVKLSKLKSSETEGSSMVEDSINDIEDSRDDMQSAVEDNDELKSSLEDEDHEVDDVVAAVVHMGTESKVSLIVDDEDSSKG